MKNLDSLFLFAEYCYAYHANISSNDEMVDKLEYLADMAELNVPLGFFEGMRKLDKKHFVISDNDLIKYASQKLNISEETIRSDKILMLEVKSMAYAISEGIALNLEKRHFTNDIPTDLLIYMLMDFSHEDDVCEVACSNGYMPAIIGMNCQSVTSFDLVQELNGFAEKNVKAAGYPKDNLRFLVDAPPYRKTLRNQNLKFDKIYTNAALNGSQYEQAKKLLKKSGRLLAFLNSRNKADVIYYDGKDNPLFEIKDKIFSIEDDLSVN